jgi:CRP/FNR family transcriptional regulator
MTQNWIDALPNLKGLDEKARAALMTGATRVAFPQGKVLLRPGDLCVQFPLIASGSVRVQRTAENGREILLYRVSSNETCILTVASLLAAETFEAEAVAETDVVAYVLGVGPFQELMSQSPAFRTLVFEGYSRRIGELMEKIEEILCTRIDVRLAERLVALAKQGLIIETTQSALALDLGTAREVVGRALHGFERSGWVKLSRGAIEVADATALSAFLAEKRE